MYYLLITHLLIQAQPYHNTPLVFPSEVLMLDLQHNTT
jgi:hypothetical protein